MEAWRKRISFITELFEAASKEGSPSSKPAKLPAPAVAVSATEKDRTTKNIEVLLWNVHLHWLAREGARVCGLQPDCPCLCGIANGRFQGWLGHHYVLWVSLHPTRGV